MRKYKVLVAEDDRAIRESLGIYLRNGNYDLAYAEDGEEALEVFRREKIDLVIMDLMMPKMDGSRAIEEIRKISYVPIIILSAKSEDLDKISGLDIGADDYMTKPFNPMELMARVHSNIRRYYRYKPSTHSDSRLDFETIVLNKASKTVEVDGKAVHITALEYRILELLMSSPNRVFTANEIYEHVWEEPAIDTKTVTVHIRRIREKIEINPNQPRYIQVSWGIGYKFVAPERRRE